MVLECKLTRLGESLFDRRAGPSAVRAGYMTLLLQSKGLLERFQKEYWPNYETEGGQRENRNYYKLVLITSVLEPMHYH